MDPWQSPHPNTTQKIGNKLIIKLLIKYLNLVFQINRNTFSLGSELDVPVYVWVFRSGLGLLCGSPYHHQWKYTNAHEQRETSICPSPTKNKQVHSDPPLEKYEDFSTSIKFLLLIGYNGDVSTLSKFKRMMLPLLWKYFLFNITNRCLTGIKGRTYSVKGGGPQSKSQFFLPP